MATDDVRSDHVAAVAIVRADAEVEPRLVQSDHVHAAAILRANDDIEAQRLVRSDHIQAAAIIRADDAVEGDRVVRCDHIYGLAIVVGADVTGRKRPPIQGEEMRRRTIGVMGQWWRRRPGMP